MTMDASSHVIFHVDIHIYIYMFIYILYTFFYFSILKKEQIKKQLSKMFHVCKSSWKKCGRFPFGNS